MKTKSLLLLAMFVAMASGVAAAVLTVSNNPGSPGQYTNLQTAIDAAGFNDTIMVSGSATSYGTITFGKPIVLVGAGYNNLYGNNTSVSSMTLTRQNLYISASGSKVMGFNVTNYVYLYGTFTGGVPASQTIDNVVFERCIINYLSFGENTSIQSFNNDTIRNCLITGTIGHGSVSYWSFNHIFYNIQVHNNIFNGGKIVGGGQYSSNPIKYADLSTFFVRNNLFLNKTTNCFEYCKNMIIENNIFYGAEPQGGITCVYNHNITYMCINNTIPGSGNLGSGNLLNTDPMLVNFPIAGGNFSCSHDVHLKQASPGLTGGTAGSQIGVYGGSSPAETCANPAFPQMMEISFPSGSSVPAGGVIDVYFKAKKQN